MEATNVVSPTLLRKDSFYLSRYLEMSDVIAEGRISWWRGWGAGRAGGYAECVPLTNFLSSEVLEIVWIPESSRYSVTYLLGRGRKREVRSLFWWNFFMEWWDENEKVWSSKAMVTLIKNIWWHFLNFQIQLFWRERKLIAARNANKPFCPHEIWWTVLKEQLLLYNEQ